MRRGALLILTAALLGSSTTHPASAGGPRNVPRDVSRDVSQLPRFGIGLSAHPDDTGIYGWMPDSGIPWDYAYQYLAGGVNTGAGWQTWNSEAQFPLWYAQGSAAAGYIPVFPYYMLLQSTGTCDSCSESERDLSNLNDPSLMAALYGDVTKLLQRLGPGTYDGIQGFGGTAVVQVEPDLSGYAEQAVLDNANCFGDCTGEGNDPALLRASVASSGVSDVAGYPDTYQGFSLAIAHLRDLYAPNVLLAFHISDWATYRDIGSDHDPGLDAAALGTQAGTFGALAGLKQVRPDTSRYDLVFNDVAYRDAAFYKYVYGWDVFWDRLNVTYPNFKRWETYVKAIVAATRRPAVVWQIPEGNQWFDTVNNSWGHYQDNRAEYFFSHIPELKRSGVIALLFGAGNEGSTVHTDGMFDGITNPPSFCTTDGLSSGQVCNTHTSAYPDDDGGYIRLAAARFYGVSLRGS